MKILWTMCYNYHSIMLDSLTNEPQATKLREHHTSKMKHYAVLLLVVLLLFNHVVTETVR